MGEDRSAGWSRRQFLGGMALGAAALAAWRPGARAAAKEPPPETTTLRLRYWNPACWAPFYMAEPLLRSEGFTDIQYVSAAGPELPELLKKGLVDLTPEFSVLGMYNAEAHGTPMKFISGLHVGCYALIGSERVRSVSNLKGKTVWAGSVPYNGPHLFLAAIVAFVGLDPQKDLTYVWVGKDEAVNQFQNGKIDALISFPPGPQELMDRGIGRVLLDTNVDKPWSQYFCCMISGHSDFMKSNPVATKRALRAILRATDFVSNHPEESTNELLARKLVKPAERQYVVHAIEDIPYAKWRLYNPEDTLRFYALRMRDTGLTKSTPQKFIDQYADWRFVNGLKTELGVTAW